MTWLPATEPIGMRLVEWGAIRFGITSAIACTADTAVKSTILPRPVTSTSVGLITVSSRCIQIGLAIASLAPILFKDAPPPTSFGLLGLAIAFTPVFTTIIYSQSASWTKHIYKPISVFSRLLVLVARIVTVVTTTIGMITALPPLATERLEERAGMVINASLIFVFLFLPYCTELNPNAKRWDQLV